MPTDSIMAEFDPWMRDIAVRMADGQYEEALRLLGKAEEHCGAMIQTVGSSELC
jgi:hypothetical protein